VKVRALTLISLAAGTNPIHNKKPKKKVTEEDEEDKAFKLKQAAGMHDCKGIKTPVANR
jgi:hypothetical protein